MNNTHFYISLPNDSSKDIFPENKQTEYTVKLPHRIQLDGEWEVALHNISYIKWSIIPINGEPIQYIENGTKRKGEKLKTYYESLDEYIKDINNSFTNEIKKKINFKVHSRKVTISLESGYKVNLRRDQAIILGFLTSEDSSIEKKIESTETATHEGNLHRETDIYVYCNIVQPQIVGDKIVPLLDIVPIKKNRKYVKQTRYIPVQTKSFEEIQILLRSSTNEPLSFERGRALVTLHFKRKSYF